MSAAVPEGMARLLADRLAESGAASEAVTVAELHKVLLPYQECRNRLGLTSKGEYDVALLRLLKDDRLLRGDEELIEAVERELENPEPGLAFLKHFAAARLGFRSSGLARVTARDRTEEEVDELLGGEGGRAAESEASASSAAEASSASESSSAPEISSAAEISSAPANGPQPTREAPGAEACFQCGEALPAGPDIRFCPHCGADQAIPRCSDCDSPLERDWKFCPRCGADARA